MTTKAFYERIFTTTELSCMEQQISFLLQKMKDLKIYTKDEFKKIQLRLEKEILDAQQSENKELVNIIEKCAEMCRTHTKQIDEELDKDSQMMEKKLEELKILRYENDFWKELELKSLVGDKIDDINEYKQNVEEYYRITTEEFDKVIKKIRSLIDEEDFEQILNYLQEWLEEEKVTSRTSTPRTPRPGEDDQPDPFGDIKKKLDKERLDELRKQLEEEANNSQENALDVSRETIDEEEYVEPDFEEN